MVSALRGQIPESFIQEVLSRVDIVDVVSRHVTLKKGGANLQGLCPFHAEKSPSFTVSPVKQFYHCFGCGAHGDAIRFSMEISGLGFIDALRELSDSCGLVWPQITVDPQERAHQEQARDERLRLSSALEQAAGHYQECLKSHEVAIAYLKGRGLTGAMAKRFGLGYAPAGWRNLASAFEKYDAKDLVDAGLVIFQESEGEDAKRYDRFRDRIMFPIRSVKGEVIGFGGRVLGSGEPKYLNSPETQVFVKGRELYGLFEARVAIRERGYALIVEGYMDVVALAQSGFDNAVATLGTACTADHVRKLLRFTDQIVFSFDGDAAGRRAASRALEAALPHASDLRTFRFLFLPPEHDPDSYVRTHGQDAFEACVQAAIPLSRQLIDRCSEGVDLAWAEGRSRLLANAKPLWAAMPECALKTQILGELAQLARLSHDELLSLWNPSVTKQRVGTGSVSSVKAASFARAKLIAPRSILQPADHVIRQLMINSALWDNMSSGDQEMVQALTSWHGEAARWLERCTVDQGPLAWPMLRQACEPLRFGPALLQLVDGAEIQIQVSAEDLELALEQLRKLVDVQRQEALKLLGRA